MKGQALSLSDMFFGLIMLILLVSFYVLVNVGVFNIQTVIQSNEVDRNTINMAQVIMSSNYTAYYDGNTIHRDVFDVTKLNQQMWTGSSAPTSLTGFENAISFPNSFALITIEDLETGQQWHADSGGGVGYPLLDIIGCINSHFDFYTNIVSFFSNPVNAWRNYINDYNIVSCIGNTASSIGNSQRSFPASIIYPNGSVHPAVLSVNLEEWSS